MTLQWVLFFGITILSYCGIAWFAQLSGGASTNSWQAFLSALRPLPLAVMVIANMFFALAVYKGFLLTKHAVPMMISVGVLTAFAYSILFLGAELTLVKTLGVALVIAGISLIAL
jgi:uncharacterized membrane protein